MYSKVFAQIYDSSIAEDYQTRYVFMDMLVLADPTGQVDMTLEAIARRTNVPTEIIRDAICKLCKPDVNSRTSTHEGRRLIPLDEHRDWGWQIVNYSMYHGMKTPELRREYMRTYMKNRREKEKVCKQDVNTVNANVNHGDGDYISKISFSETENPSSEKVTQTKLIEDKILGTFPCDGPVKEWYYLKSYHEQLCKSYETVDVRAEVKKARAWIDANPNKRKTARGMTRFINGWLCKACNR